MKDTSPVRRDPSIKWPANAADRTNAVPPAIPRSPDSGHWLEQEPRQHNPSTNSNDPLEGRGGSELLPNWDPNNLPFPSPTRQPPTSEPPTDEPHPLNPSSPLTHGNTDLNPSYYQAQGQTDGSHVLNPTPASSSSSGSFFSGLSQTPAHDTLPGGSPQMASSPDSGGSHQLSSLPQHHLPSDGYSMSSVSTTESPVQLPTGESHPPTLGPIDNHPPSASPSNLDSSTGPHPLPSSELPNEDHAMTVSKKLSTSPDPDETHPLSLGPNHPPGPGPTDNPPPSLKRPHPEDHESWDSLSKIFKGKFKRRFFGSGALNAAQGEFQGIINSRTYVTANFLPLLPTNDHSHEHSNRSLQ